MRVRKIKPLAQITADRGRELLIYDPETGVFTRRITAGKFLAGTIAGTESAVGYIYIGIDGMPRLAHRLAWMYVHGAWPADQIDHINGNKSDNRIANLRDVSRATNMQNLKGARKDNKSSGLLGVTFNRHAGKFAAQITVEGKMRNLGLYGSPQEAHAAYLAEKRRVHHGCTI